MRLYRIRAVARKESLHVFRDARSLMLGIGIPLFLLVLFGYALTLDVDRVPLAVWDQSRTPESRLLISRFTGSRYFSLQSSADGYPSLEQAIDKGDALLALVIPVDFASKVYTGEKAEVQLIMDGSDSNTATIALGYADAIGAAYSENLKSEYFRLIGGRPPDPPIALHARIWFNPELESKNNIVPGLIAVIMMVIAALLTSLTIAREWEKGTMEQLISTPVKGSELVIGKLIPYFVIGIADVALIIFAGTWLFDIPLRGSIPFLFAMAAIFLIGALSTGIIISIIAKNQLVASQLAMVLTFLPSFLLSGFITAIHNMPYPIQLISYLVPARYFVGAIRAIYLKGVGPAVLINDIILLVIFSVAAFALALLKFKKKLE